MSKTMSLAGALALVLGLGAGCRARPGEDRVIGEAMTKPVERTAADNTGTNERDRSATETTAQHAGMAQSDTDIMAKIRRAVVDDDTLSTNAHNVKIVAAHGIVTLKGPVASQVEKDVIAQKATDVVGAANVVNELEIAP